MEGLQNVVIIVVQPSLAPIAGAVITTLSYVMLEQAVDIRNVSVE